MIARPYSGDLREYDLPACGCEYWGQCFERREEVLEGASHGECGTGANGRAYALKKAVFAIDQFDFANPAKVHSRRGHFRDQCI